MTIDIGAVLCYNIYIKLITRTRQRNQTQLAAAIFAGIAGFTGGE